jgi:FtsP/CotA-like multicopper oxidase with cupredoxin domain
MMRALLRLTLCIFTLLPLTIHAAPTDSLQPRDWDAGLKLPEARDMNPDPRILEINLGARIAEVEIEPGKSVKAWTYDGGLPGPLIRLNVGDRLIVHFKNELPSPTTVHWHGVRVPIEMDGVPGISQPEVETGGTFTYDFVVPDAGLFWYHPHVMSAQQVGFGLYGALLVEDPSEKVGVDDEVVLVLSDIEIGHDGTLEGADTGGSSGMAFGREGNVLLVNGRKNPRLAARSGAPQRWRIANTAKTRYFKLDMGEGNSFTKIGGDGGLQEYSVEYEMLVLAPGERADVIVTPRAKPGTELVVLAQLHNRGYGSVEYRAIEGLFNIAFSTEAEYRGAPLPKIERVIEPMTAAGATAVTLNLHISQDPRDGSFEYDINGKPYWKAEPIPAKLGETQLWTVNNTTPWSHPLHIHGFFFQVLDANGSPVRPLQWKDTVDVPFKETLQLLVRFDDRPGAWMVHCHILDHAEGGLMTTVQVGDTPGGNHHLSHEH